jgi:hypothetical protein
MLTINLMKKYGLTRRENIEIDLEGTKHEVVDWIQLIQEMVCWRTLVNTVMNLCVP